MLDNLIASLNVAQRSAVTAPLGHQLVLAGAGSGKTRVLTCRFAWLVNVAAIPATEIMAVTFTNKAALEMRQRINELLPQVNNSNLWVGTFHNLSYRILRINWQEAGLDENFHIIDAADQMQLLKRIIGELQLDTDKFSPKDALVFINHNKDKAYKAHQVQLDPRDPRQQRWQQIYQIYETICKRDGLVDFTDLLLLVHQLWDEQPQLLNHYRQRFKYILVDEFQDTNVMQYRWITKLLGSQGFITIVGDDDQSIYGWRGAQVANLQRFREDFPAGSLVRLEQNYRSTSTILQAANTLINNNTGRLGKTLWTTAAAGEKITIYSAINEFDEADFIAKQIIHKNQRYQLGDMAILYRSNAQSRVIEQTLIQYGINYRIYGGLRFFERAEIKDALAYVRLLLNPNDNAAFERIVNLPTRGIGDNTLTILRQHAQQLQLSLWQAAEHLLASKAFNARSANGISQFIELINYLIAAAHSLDIAELINKVIHHSGLINYYSKEKGEQGVARIENLTELVNAAKEFTLEVNKTNPGIAPLAAFLSYTALDSNTDDSYNKEHIQLMTLHAAKGLEFAVVFLAGCEENIFPHYLSQDDPQQLEEERRLCYVGITRAMQQLYLSYAKTRQLYGKKTYNQPSRFLAELPTELLKTNYYNKTTVTPTMTVKPSNNKIASDLLVGRQVYHQQFGEGLVLQQEGQGSRARLQINFAQMGIKWLIASYVTVLF
jgi:DNA helicase-2/ATP-dependent DNA helicase PcrA